MDIFIILVILLTPIEPIICPEDMYDVFNDIEYRVTSVDLTFEESEINTGISTMVSTRNSESTEYIVGFVEFAQLGPDI